MRGMRLTLLVLPLALLLSSAVFGEPSNKPSPLTMVQLEEAIFGAPEGMSSPLVRHSEWWGVCALSCAPCWGPEDCNPGEPCVWNCY